MLRVVYLFIIIDFILYVFMFMIVQKGIVIALTF